MHYPIHVSRNVVISVSIQSISRKKPMYSRPKVQSLTVQCLATEDAALDFAALHSHISVLRLYGLAPDTYRDVGPITMTI